MTEELEEPTNEDDSEDPTFGEQFESATGVADESGDEDQTSNEPAETELSEEEQPLVKPESEEEEEEEADSNPNAEADTDTDPDPNFDDIINGLGETDTTDLTAQLAARDAQIAMLQDAVRSQTQTQAQDLTGQDSDLSKESYRWFEPEQFEEIMQDPKAFNGFLNRQYRFMMEKVQERMMPVITSTIQEAQQGTDVVREFYQANSDLRDHQDVVDLVATKVLNARPQLQGTPQFFEVVAKATRAKMGLADPGIVNKGKKSSRRRSPNGRRNQQARVRKRDQPAFAGGSKGSNRQSGGSNKKTGFDKEFDAALDALGQ